MSRSISCHAITLPAVHHGIRCAASNQQAKLCVQFQSLLLQSLRHSVPVRSSPSRSTASGSKRVSAAMASKSCPMKRACVDPVCTVLRAIRESAGLTPWLDLRMKPHLELRRHTPMFWRVGRSVRPSSQLAGKSGTTNGRLSAGSACLRYSGPRINTFANIRGWRIFANSEAK